MVRAVKAAVLTPVVLDSSCWLEFLMDTPRAVLYADILEDSDALLVPVITVYEVIKKIVRELGDDIASSSLVLMQRSTIVGVDLALATQAMRNGLPLADSLIYATAQMHGATLWTQDQHFEGLPGVRYFQKSMQKITE
jgi:toxin FitB